MKGSKKPPGIEDNDKLIAFHSTLELLRKGVISQGKAAELLKIDRHALFDLMAHYDIPVIEMTQEELKEGLSKPLW